MNKSDTPRTDAIHDFEWRCEHHPDHQEGMVTSAMIEIRLREESDELREHARQLERELAALRAQFEAQLSAWKAQQFHLEAEERENELLEALLAERDAEIKALKGHDGEHNYCVDSERERIDPLIPRVPRKRAEADK